MSTTTKSLLNAKVIDRYLLNKKGSIKKTYHIVLKLPSPIEYKVGDSIAIHPTNPESIVDKLLTFFPLEKSIQHKKTKDPFNLREYLLSQANLSKITTTFIKKLAGKSSCNNLLDLVKPENKTALLEYLEKRDLLDILESYPNQLSAQETIDLLLPLLPRYYSIASSNQVDPYKIHLTVAHVTYTFLNKDRVGIGSHFLCEIAQQDTDIPFFIQPSKDFTLPSPEKPIIMIGPGTGIAPFRAFLEERIHNNGSGENWLFFGECNKDTDFYYESYFSQLEKQKKLKLTTAFSRDQQEKIYVQHRILENSATIVSWLDRGATLYVCGDAKKMAKDVEKALIRILSEEKNLLESDAKSYLKTLRKEKRYLTDVY